MYALAKAIDFTLLLHMKRWVVLLCCVPSIQLLNIFEYQFPHPPLSIHIISQSHKKIHITHTLACVRFAQLYTTYVCHSVVSMANVYNL